MYDFSHIKNFHPVNDRLFTGGQPNEKDFTKLKKAGIETVINLALHDDPKYSLPDERGIIESLGMEYIHIPVIFDDPTRSDLEKFFFAMRANETKHLLVHCAANYRVSAFLGIYWYTQKNWTEEKAFALMRAIWEPNTIWKTFIAVFIT